jgi:hypothetical protein
LDDEKETTINVTKSADAEMTRDVEGDENAVRSQPARDAKIEAPSLNENAMLQDKELEGEA